MGCTTPDTTSLLLGYFSRSAESTFEAIPNYADMPGHDAAAEPGIGYTKTVTEMIDIDAQMGPKLLTEAAGAHAVAVSTMPGPESHASAANHDIAELTQVVRNAVTKAIDKMTEIDFSLVVEEDTRFGDELLSKIIP